MNLRKWCAGLLAAAAAVPAQAADYRARLPQDEVIYFLLPDRFENGDPKNDLGGLKGDRLKTGYDPTHKGYYHGGDLKGLIKRLDYVQGMGVTAIWVAPIFKNKPVQGPPGQESAAYHGYWVTDFTQVDPHLGTNDDFKALVDAAHARGMKVYMDIIANHTADVIQYKGCPIQACGYRSIADYPYQRRGGINGEAINPGFTGDDNRSAENFARLTNPHFAYEVEIPAAEKNVKVPAWLNDPIWYHNRGNSEWHGESNIYGDFSGLDDIYTEHPRVVAGLIEVFGSWIDWFGIDGFRIDTARHVNPEFWQAFAPAMLERAKAKGIPNFHIFGEVYSWMNNPSETAVHTVVDRLPAVLDFPFAKTVVDVVGGTTPPSQLASLFKSDALYAGGERAAQQLPTFLGNHDAGRFSGWVRKGLPKADAEELLDRVILGHAMMLTLRGVPTIYYGDEQGFISDGGDQGARESMFPSKVVSYNDNDLLGSDRTTAVANFDTDHPIYRAISLLARLRTSTPALTRGLQKVRFAANDKPGLFAVSRFDPVTDKEVLLLFNSSTEPLSQNVVVDVKSQRFSALAGQCAPEASAPGSVRVTLAGLGYAVCAAE